MKKHPDKRPGVSLFSHNADFQYFTPLEWTHIPDAACQNKTYTKIFVADKNKVSDSIKDLVDNYQAELIEINTMDTLTDQERNNKDNYLTIMNDFTTKLSDTVLK